MAKDYIKRQKNPNREPVRKETSKELRKQLRVLAISIVVFIGLISGVQYLAVPTGRVIDDDSNQKQSNSLRQTKDNREEVKKIPPPPEERWDYVELLKNKEVEIKAKERQKINKRYQLQCGAYQTMKQAQTRVSALSQYKIPSVIKEVIVKEIKWYRVILGPYPSMRKVETARHKLQNIGIELCVVRSPP